MNGVFVSRSADYTIIGFLYQFNKTILEILNAKDKEFVTVEGIIEDVDISSSDSITAIQCKYHEAKTKFTVSTIYKPLLQMMLHFSKNTHLQVQYILFTYFPDKNIRDNCIGKKECEAALKTKNKEFKKKYVAHIPTNLDLNEFLLRFKIEFGPSYETLVAQVTTALEKNGIPKADMDTLAYPNAIYIISEISMNHDINARKITKREFIDKIKKIKITAISRWTIELHTRKKLLHARKQQIQHHLAINTRQRYFIIDPKEIEDFNEEIVLFIRDFLDKYHMKLTHTMTPVIFLHENQEKVNDLIYRLYIKGKLSNNGYIGSQFVESYFFRKPMIERSKSDVKREFDICITNFSDHGEMINKHKCDDLFVIGSPIIEWIDTTDVNVEHFTGTTIKEIKYLFGVKNACE